MSDGTKAIIAAEFLARLSYERSNQWWDSVLSEAPPRSCLYVLEIDKPIGFAYAGETRAEELPYEAELYAIYVLEEYQRSGGGRQLFDAVCRSLVGSGFHSMMLWVLENNPSRNFYERLGGVVVGSKQDRLGDQTVTEIAYGWRDLAFRC